MVQLIPSGAATAAAAALLAASSAHAGGYVEPPDLSNNRLAPTVITLDPGSNIVRGTMGYNARFELDRDFFSFTVPSGFQLQAVVLGPATQVGGCCSFIGVQAAAALSVDPDTVFSGAQLLGWHLYATADKGSDILPAIGAPPDKIGFSGPLPAGVYTWWVQELAPGGPYSYEFDFQLAPVPEPAGWALLAAGAVMLGARARRRC